MSDWTWEITRKNSPDSLSTRQLQSPGHEASEASFHILPTTFGDGASPQPMVQAAMLNQATGNQLSRAGHSLLQLQRRYGNRYVQRIVAQACQTQVSTTDPAPLIIQPKMLLGPAEDKYEREADQIAQSMARQPTNGELVSFRPSKYNVQRESVTETGATVDANVEQAIRRAQGGGQPLDSNLRETLGQQFGADFSGVHIHTDSQANSLNHTLQARAFTTGQDIFFRQGEYRPQSQQGQALIAHELAHVVQQKRESLKSASTVQRKIGMEFEMHIFPVDQLQGSKEEIAAMTDEQISKAGQVPDKTPIEETKDYKLTVDNTSINQLVKGPWNTQQLIFSRAASPSILEIVSKPAETYEELKEKIGSCIQLAQDLYKLTDSLKKRANYNGYFIGPINNELDNVPLETRKEILVRNGKWETLLNAFQGNENAVLNIDGFKQFSEEVTGLSTKAKIQVNLGVSMRHLTEFAEWYGKDVIYGGNKQPAETDPMTYKALYYSPYLGKETVKQLRAHLLAGIKNIPQMEEIDKSTNIPDLPGIEGLFTLVSMYIMGAFEEVNASETRYGTEKNLSHMLSKTALYEAFQHSLTPFEKYTWQSKKVEIKANLLHIINQYLSYIRQQPINISGENKVMNWYWASTEREVDKLNPELWDLQSQKSFVNVTINELFDDILGSKDRLLMRLYQIPTSNESTYSGEGPIPLDKDQQNVYPLSVIEFRTIPGFKTINEWWPIAEGFFDKAQEIHQK